MAKGAERPQRIAGHIVTRARSGGGWNAVDTPLKLHFRIWRERALPLLSFLKRLTGDRRAEGDRRGDSRAEGSQRRSGQCRRSHERRVIYSQAPVGELELLDGTRFLATLWDISKGGACVLVPGSITRLNPNELCTLTLKEKGSREEVVLKLKVAWSAMEDAGTYVGLKLRTGAKIPAGSFLERLHRNR